MYLYFVPLSELKHFGLLKQFYRPLGSWSAQKSYNQDLLEKSERKSYNLDNPKEHSRTNPNASLEIQSQGTSKDESQSITWDLKQKNRISVRPPELATEKYSASMC